MENTYGYIRTSRQRIAGEAGSDPEAQALQLRGVGVAPEDIYRDVGVSGSIGTNSRAGSQPGQPLPPGPGTPPGFGLPRRF